MATESEMEQFRVDQNPPIHLRDFVNEAKRVQQVIAREFRVVRSDSQTVNPPIRIFNDKTLDEMVLPSLAIAPGSDSSLCAYQPLADIIDVSARLTNYEDLEMRTLALAEEFTHAQTTRDFGDHIRIAYATYPYPRVSSLLKPGAIYNLSSHQSVPQEEEGDTIVKGDSSIVLLLERTTLLALHLMLDRLLPDRYPLLVLMRKSEQPIPLIKDRQLLADVLGSMYLDNRKLLPSNLLTLFQDPKPITWASSTMREDKKSNMVTMQL